MSRYGEVYVEISASVVNGGINTLATSGEYGDDGITGLQAWLLWSYDENGDGGYTGHGWFWDDANNDLVLSWSTQAPTIPKKYNNLEVYSSDEAGFKEYLRDYQPENLNQFLSSWDLSRKETFVNTNMGILGVKPVVPSGCIEIHS